MVKKAALLLVLVFIYAPSAFSQMTSATASTDKTDYLIGDYIHYSIKVSYLKGITVYPPMIEDSLKNAVLLKTDKPVMTESGSSMSATYPFVLSCYDSTGVTIPAIPILFRAAGDTALREVSTNPVSFTVTTVKVNMKSDIKDVKGPIGIPFDWRWLLLWIAVALIVAAIAHYLYRTYRRKKAAAASVKPSRMILPHEAALGALRELESKQLWQKGMIKDYHSEITEIIRKYFEQRFDMPALEMTTSETVDLLRTRPGSKPVWELTYDFLSNADMVKFARYTPMGSVNEEMMQQAYDIINKTAPSPDDIRKEEAANVQGH